MMAANTPITIDFPSWVYIVFSAVGLTFVFLVGYHCCIVHGICKEFPKIRRALDLISQKLFEKGFFKEQVFVSSGSPIQLTEVGRKMLKDSGFEDFFNTNKDNFYKEIDFKTPKTPFEVEKAARELLIYLDLDKTPKSELIKNYAYNNGMVTGDILFAYSIEVRDRYLKVHPELLGPTNLQGS